MDEVDEVDGVINGKQSIAFYYGDIYLESVKPSQ